MPAGPGGLPGPGAESLPAPDQGAPVAKPSLTFADLGFDGWPRALQLASLLFAGQVAIYLVLGVLGALEALIAEGVAPEPLDDLFRRPFQMLLAANGGVEAVGWWLTGLAVVVMVGRFVVGRLVPPLDPSTGPNWFMRALVLTGMAAFVHSLVLLVASFLVSTDGFGIAPTVRLPGSLAELPFVVGWSRTRLLLVSFVVVWVSLVGLAVLRPTTALPRRLVTPVQAVRSGTAVFFWFTLVAGAVVVVAGALELPSEPSARRWLAQSVGYGAASLSVILDLGGHELARAFAVVGGEPTVTPIRGSWVVVIIAAALVTATAGVVRTSRTPQPDQRLGASLGGAAVAGLAMVSLLALNGSTPGLAPTVALLAVGLPILAVVASSEVRTALWRTLNRMGGPVSQPQANQPQVSQPQVSQPQASTATAELVPADDRPVPPGDEPNGQPGTAGTE